MTNTFEQHARRLAWLCNELAAGNQFSNAQLHKWADQAITALNQAETGRCNPQPLTSGWSGETARRRVGGTFGS